jgi:hypothetical protein
MVKLFKSNKAMAIVVIVLLAASLGFAYFGISSRSKLSDKEKEIQQLRDEAKGFQDMTNLLSKENENLKKTTISKDNYARMLNAVLSLKNTAISSGLLSASTSFSSPDQICEALKPLLQGSSQSASPITEVDFLASVVEKEISSKGVVDTKEADKNALCLYHMQKVLNAIGYGFSGEITTTNQAVIKFQTDNQLKADGKVGAKTWAKVREVWNARKPQG